jgi:hypothetical protein
MTTTYTRLANGDIKVTGKPKQLPEVELRYWLGRNTTPTECRCIDSDDFFKVESASIEKHYKHGYTVTLRGKNAHNHFWFTTLSEAKAWLLETHVN